MQDVNLGTPVIIAFAKQDLLVITAKSILMTVRQILAFMGGVLMALTSMNAFVNMDIGASIASGN